MLTTKRSSSFPSLAGSTAPHLCSDCRRGAKTTATGPRARADRVRLRDALSGELRDFEFAGPPDDETVKLARFTIRLATEHLRNYLPVRSRKVQNELGEEYFQRWRAHLKWLPSGGRSRGISVASRGFIAIDRSLRGFELVETVLHEVRHLAQEKVPHLADLNHVAELDAELYAATWAWPFWLAAREAKADPWRVTFAKFAPYGRAEGRDVVITKDGRIWKHFGYTGWVRIRQ